MELSSDNPEKQKFLIFSEKQKNQFLACAWKNKKSAQNKFLIFSDKKLKSRGVAKI